MMSQFDQRVLQQSLRTRVIKMIVSILLLAVCLAITVALWFAVDEQDIAVDNMPTETVTITRVKKFKVNHNTIYTYYTQIGSKEVEIHNVNGYPKKKGDTITAYIYKGKYYGSVIGAKHSTVTGNAYFVFLALCIFALWYMMVEIVYFKKKLQLMKEMKQTRNEKQEC